MVPRAATLDSLPRAVLYESWLAVCREVSPKVSIGIKRLPFGSIDPCYHGACSSPEVLLYFSH
jgi:hypothetical protein